jgi:hypothetical protein
VQNLAHKVKPIKVLLLPVNTLHRSHCHQPQPARFCLLPWHLVNWLLLLNHLPPLEKFCQPLKMPVPGNLLTDLPSHCHPAKALPPLVRFCLLLKMPVPDNLLMDLPSHCHPAKALPPLVKFCLLHKVQPLQVRYCPPR